MREKIKGNVLFFVNTPFQALCAIEAIRRFDIEKYRLYVAYFANENRLKQIDDVLGLFNIHYSSLLLKKTSSLTFLIRSLFRRKYEMAFVGDFYTIILACFSIVSLKPTGQLFYMDDGNSTIDIFKDVLSPMKTGGKFQKLREFVKWMGKKKGIKVEKNFFSIFPDIPNMKYQVIENDFSHIKSLYDTMNTQSLSLFVGTVTEGFCEENNLSIEQYHNVLKELLVKAQKDAGKIVYIPHGRDRDSFVMNLCNNYGIEYRKLEVCIELYILQNGICPEFVYGFSSSALYSLKRMFPDAKVCNVRIISSNPSREYDDIATYYHQHNINNIVYNVQ